MPIGNMLEEILTKEGYGVTRAYSGTEALLVLSQARPDLVLLDLMLPGLCGEAVLPRIQGIPTIVVSAKADIDNKVALLLGGAADYITKPFNTKELLARIAVQLRSASSANAATLIFDDLSLDTGTHLAAVGKEPTRQADPHRIRDPEAADAEPGTGHNEIRAARSYQHGYARLHRKLAEDAYQQPPQKTASG